MKGEKERDNMRIMDFDLNSPLYSIISDYIFYKWWSTRTLTQFNYIK